MLLSLNPAMDLSQRARLDVTRYTRTPSLGDTVVAAIRACNTLEQQLQKFRRSRQLLRDAVLEDKLFSNPFPGTHGVAKGVAFECAMPPAEVEVVACAATNPNTRINVRLCK